MLLARVVAGLALITTALALALPLDNSCQSSVLTAELLQEIAPASSTCEGALYPNECRTAQQAVCPISKSFAKYGITHPAVQAALISLISYESGDFRYNQNHFPAPGILGQGTRNMQMPASNVRYEQALGGKSYEDILGNDDWSFGSAAWYLVTECSFTYRQALWSGSTSAYQSFLQQCVGADVNEKRLEYWARASKALGVAQMA